MEHSFRTQAEYFLRLAHVADAPEDKAKLVSMGCAWHRLGQELDLRHAHDTERSQAA
jgi:hypothetical protein